MGFPFLSLGFASGSIPSDWKLFLASKSLKITGLALVSRLPADQRARSLPALCIFLIVNSLKYSKAFTLCKNYFIIRSHAPN